MVLEVMLNKVDVYEEEQLEIKIREDGHKIVSSHTPP